MQRRGSRRWPEGQKNDRMSRMSRMTEISTTAKAQVPDIMDILRLGWNSKPGLEHG